MTRKKGLLIIVLALISTALLVFYWTGCSPLSASDVSQALAKSLTDNLTINNGTKVDSAPPAGNASTSFPQIATIAGNATLSAGQTINVNLTTSFTNTIQGAVMYVDNTHGQTASNYIKIVQSVSSGVAAENPNPDDSKETKVNLNITQLGSGKTMAITGSLPSTSWLSTSTVFNIKIAMVGSDFSTGLGNYATWTVAVVSAGGSDGGSIDYDCINTGSMGRCRDTKTCCTRSSPTQCYYYADGTKFQCAQGPQGPDCNSAAQQMTNYCMGF